MAGVAEVYEQAGVIHRKGCTICVIDTQQKEQKVSRVDLVIVSLVGLAIGFFVGLAIAWQPLPLERLHGDFKHVELYEDGSYTVRSWDNSSTMGCLPQAQCNK
jgi:hypothetical protein